MNDPNARISRYSDRDAEQRRHWYSDAAAAYDKTRPRYSEDAIQRAVDTARLVPGAALLEVGCGPGIATAAFARRGFSLLGLEPNPGFWAIAQQNCAAYPNVELVNTLFEEWEPEGRKFDAVLAATSIHWVPPEARHTKAAAALRAGGALILLWNAGLQPPSDVSERFQAAYAAHAPDLVWNKSKETQAEELWEIGQGFVDSGLFRELVFEKTVCEATYGAEDYLLLLSSYSSFIELEPQRRAGLFEALRRAIEDMGGTVPLSYLSAVHVLQKR